MSRHTRMLVLAAFVLAAVPAAVALAKTVIDVSGTSWGMDLTMQMKVQKVGSLKDTLVPAPTLYLGPIDGAAAGEFKIVDETSHEYEYTGTWSDPKHNGNLVATMDTGELTDAVTDTFAMVLEQKFGYFQDVWADITSIKLQIKLKPGKTGSFSMTVTFNGGATIDGEDYTGKGSMTVKGKVYPI